MLACTAFSIPCRWAVASTNPIARSIPPIGSSSSPNVSASRKITSESVDPTKSANRLGSTASIRSRRIS